MIEITFGFVAAICWGLHDFLVRFIVKKVTIFSALLCTNLFGILFLAGSFFLTEQNFILSETFILISISWVPFFSKSSQDTIDIISSIFTYDLVNDDFLPIAVQYFNLKFLIVASICIASLLNIKVSKKIFENWFLTISIFIFSLVLVIASSVDPFIYFRF